VASEPATQPTEVTPIDTVREAFVKALDLPADTNTETLEIGVTPEWDSVGHMTLVAELEEQFGIALETDDLVAMSSFPVSLEILRRYGVAV
jgi:acyl carrier protein